MSRKNPTGAPKKSRVKIVFPASNAATTAAGYAAAGGTAVAIRDRFKIFTGNEDEGMALGPFNLSQSPQSTQRKIKKTL